MKKALRLVVLVLFTSLVWRGAMAQDPHFSQFGMSPLTLNPAMTGVFNGSYRLAALYRHQWNSVLRGESTPAFMTFAGSGDLRLKLRPTRDAVGVGLMVMSDKAGEAEYGTTLANGSVSYMKALGYQAKSYLSAGVFGGIAQRGINYTKLRFGSQFNGSGYSPDLPTGESLNIDNYLFLDFGAGAFWFYTPEARRNFWAGASVFHLNRPNQSFFEGEEVPLPMRFAFSAGTQFPVGDQFDVLPSLLVMKQGLAFETNVGGYFKFFFERNQPLGNAFYIGPWYRIVGADPSIPGDGIIGSDALILATRIDYGTFSIGFSYDLNFSELSPASNTNGGFEIAIVHIGNFSERSRAQFCPRF